jgi:hypothetical protein
MSTILRSEVLGTVSELSKREAQSLPENRLRAVNRGRAVPRSNFNFRRFVEDEFRPFVLSTLKFATRKNYTFLFDKHLLPRFGEECLADNALVFSKGDNESLSSDNLRKKRLTFACRRTGLRRIDWPTLCHRYSTILHDLGTPIKGSTNLTGALQRGENDGYLHTPYCQVWA